MSALCDGLQNILVERGPESLKDDPAAQAHLSDCPECFAFLEALAEVDSALAQMPEHDVSFEQVAQTLAAVGVDSATSPEPATADTPPPAAPRPASRGRRIAMRLRQLCWSILTWRWLRRLFTRENRRRLFRWQVMVPVGAAGLLVSVGSLGLVLVSGVVLHAPAGDSLYEDLAVDEIRSVDRKAQLVLEPPADAERESSTVQVDRGGEGGAVADGSVGIGRLGYVGPELLKKQRASGPGTRGAVDRGLVEDDTPTLPTLKPAPSAPMPGEALAANGLPAAAPMGVDQGVRAGVGWDTQRQRDEMPSQVVDGRFGSGKKDATKAVRIKAQPAPAKVTGEPEISIGQGTAVIAGQDKDGKGKSAHDTAAQAGILAQLGQAEGHGGVVDLLSADEAKNVRQPAEQNQPVAGKTTMRRERHERLVDRHLAREKKVKEEARRWSSRGEEEIPLRAEVRGSLDKNLIARVIARAEPQLNRTVAAARAGGAGGPVRLNVHFVIEPTGRVSRVQIKESTTRNAALIGAMRAVFENLRFPAPAGGGIVVVSYPVTIEPDGTVRLRKSGEESNPNLAAQLLQQREQTDNLAFREAVGYWANTYVPGDPEYRLLHARLGQLDQADWVSAIKGQARLDAAARQYAQPFDAPAHSALAVFLSGDRAGVEGPTRMLVQVGLKGTTRRSRSRPTMNVGVVLDLSQPVSVDDQHAIRALVTALSQARAIGDRFVLLAAGTTDARMVPPDAFRHGPLTVALQKMFVQSTNGSGGGWTVTEAMERATQQVVGADDPTTPLGSSLVLLVTPRSLGTEMTVLTELAHESAVNGVPVSVVGVGDAIQLGELDQLALAGQGNRRLLTAANEAEALVGRELYAVSGVVARAVRLRIRLAPDVQLVDVLGSRRLDAVRADQVRQAEQSIDRRLSRNLGVVSDRGDDEDGIQIVIPAFYAEDHHVILLDVVVPGSGPVADVRVRYKDLVHLRNGVSRANLTVARGYLRAGPLEQNVTKNFLARLVADHLRRSGAALAGGQLEKGEAILVEARNLLNGMMALLPAFDGDRDLLADVEMIGEYLALLDTNGALEEAPRQFVAASLRYAAFLKVLPPPRVD